MTDEIRGRGRPTSAKDRQPHRCYACTGEIGAYDLVYFGPGAKLKCHECGPWGKDEYEYAEIQLRVDAAVMSLNIDTRTVLPPLKTVGGRGSLNVPRMNRGPRS